MTEKSELEAQKVLKAPPKIYYIPEYVTKEEEESLMKNVYSAPKPKWTQLSNRRLQNWGGLPHPKGMVSEGLPPWLKVYTERIAVTGAGLFEDKSLNHVLVNEYKAGQGIMPHEDGSLFFPTVSTISLGSHTLLDFYYHIKQDQDSTQNNSTSLDERHFVSILLEPRSLVFVAEDMYKLHLHGIAERTSDVITDKVANLDMCKSVSVGDKLTRSARVSLTIRHVPKTLKAKLFLGKR
ncbi:alpha-ketoglutarate-dependent dioxygenase alkB homolog 6-like isoform X1 [Mizuhopecten yessoensis]|uniref:alpha-ketoglutarate-dependent dioxygenase alkB homolog 6-like isoform X1 n=2 Tax=Mizuhopecten yessoensis TaxID=6573 RepID=UPI000B459850|nr:alpha-ketoglutarate-dependent dioxygenase alkB homolog 6-like isoform X1 [Mizuhopecten yessoensis]